MIFRHEEEPIDDLLLELVKKVKSLIKQRPSVQWISSTGAWVIGTKNWLSEKEVFIKYDYLIRDKFQVYTGCKEDKTYDVLKSFSNTREVVIFLQLLKFLDLGVKYEVMNFLAEKSQKVSLQEAINMLPLEESIALTISEMEILGIDPKFRGTITGRKFNI